MAHDEPKPAAEAVATHDDAAFLRSVLEAVPAFVMMIDAEHCILYINRLQPGYVLADVVGRSIEEYTAPECVAVQREAIEVALRSGQPQSFTMKGAGGGDRVAYYESRAVPITDREGRRAVCLIALEVTEHVARAEALKESEEKLRLAVEATGIGLWSYDVLHDRAEWSPRMCELMGSEQPMSMQDYMKLVHPEDRSRVARDEPRLATGTPEFVNHRIVRGDGELRWVVPTGRVQRDERGNVVRIMGGLLDVTAQQRVEEHLRHAQKMDAVGALTAGVAHNFNNMLAVIMPALEIAVRTADDKHRKLFSDAAHASRRAAELVAQLMMFAGQRRAHAPQRENIALIVQRAISMCERTFAPHFALESHLDTSCAPVRCDDSAMEQVVVNLLINARDAIAAAERDQPYLQVEVAEVSARPPGPADAPEGRYARITVRDNGIGMSAEVQRRLFEPFFTTKSPGRGTGLGLATSYAMVRDQGGFIVFDSKEGVGTRAEIYLPVDDASAESLEPPAPAPSAARLGVVLVIDDEAAVRNATAEVLRMRGHTPLLAAEGRAAVALLDDGERPDLVLLDRAMPGWPVRTVLAELRKRIPETPVVFFTGHDVGDDERALVQGVLHKPVSMDELLAAVERFLPRR